METNKRVSLLTNYRSQLILSHLTSSHIQRYIQLSILVLFSLNPRLRGHDIWIAAFVCRIFYCRMGMINDRLLRDKLGFNTEDLDFDIKDLEKFD